MKIIPDFLETSARRFPDKEALVFEGTRLTYRQWNEKAEEVCHLVQAHCQKQEPVSIILENSANFLIAYFAILKAGCIAHIVPTNISDSNFELQIKEVEPTLIITGTKFLPILKGKSPVLNLDESSPAIKNKEKRIVLPEDVSTIIYSSGTTSRQKGIKLQHKNVVAATEQMLEALGVNENDSYLNILPLAHSFGLGNVHMTIRQGGKVIIERNSINIPAFLHKISDEKATAFAAVPATLKTIAENFRDLFQQCRNLRLIVTNSAPIAPEVTKKVLEALPRTQFYTYYGLTEASRSTFNHFNNCPQGKLRSVGKAALNTKIKIVNEEGKNLLPFQEGEICIQGEHVIAEYWKNPEATAAIKNEWIHTGDFGYIDEEGYLFLAGRKDEMINVGGEKVAPAEIEDKLKMIPGLQELAVFGVRDPTLNEAVAAVYAGPLARELFLQEARKKLEGYKVPRYVFKTTELPSQQIPKTDSGKIKRNQLRQEAESLIHGK